MPDCVALIVAAGRGHRFGGDLPKQYRRLAGRPVLARTAAAFATHAGVDAVRVVIHPDDIGLYEEAVAGLDLLPPVPGGAERQDSVRLGLESLESLGPSRVLIHDGARPCVTPGVIDRTLAALETAPGAVAAVPVNDTLKRARADGTVDGTVDRTGLWRAQTPQAFRFAEILAAHRKAAGRAFTDDAAVAEAAGLAVALVPGDEDNVKITTEDDLRRAAAFLAGGEIRTGLGYDVHRFGPGDHVWLCGVRIAHDRGLVGHSDADVGLHALVDAILGAIGAGDIGGHFPPSDPRWKGAPSREFLAHAGALVRERRGEVVHVDVTLIAEAPRIGPHREAMRATIAEILGVDVGRTSVKATTTEGLGFAGRGEGIAAQAVATLRLPAGD